MKTDKNGCSTTKKGEEQYEIFYTPRKKKMFQYDFRNESGELFSCIGLTLAECRQKKKDYFEAQKPEKNNQ
jgi:hypothetical protein